MEKKQNASKLISSLVALSLATTLGVPTIALADEGNVDGGATANTTATQSADGQEATNEATTPASRTTAALPKVDNQGVIAITENGDYAIDENTTASIVISKDVTATLTIADGVTLINTSGKHTITNNGELTIEGAGIIDNQSHQKAAIYNAPGAIATLNGCTFTRSKETGQSKEQSGGNSYYSIQNQGTMIINNGVTVNQGADGNGKFSSLVTNGWFDGNGNTTKAESSLTINGGKFSGGLNVIKNDDWGVLNIKGGDFTAFAQSALLNWNVTTISGGTFEKASETSSEYPTVLNGKLDDTMDRGKLTIEKGQFTSNNSIIGWMNSSGNTTIGDIKISGGTFVSAATSNTPLFNLGADDSYKNIEISGGEFSDPSIYQYAVSGTVNVNMTKDYEGSITIKPDVIANINLGGKTLSRNNGQVLDIYGEATLSNGAVKAVNTSDENTISAAWVNGTAKLTVEKDATIATTGKSFGISYWKDCTSADVILKGKVLGTEGVAMNGEIPTNTSNKLLLDGATINVTGHGIYQAGGAETDFSLNNSTVKGGSTGIEVRAGKLTVDNCTIEGGQGETSATANGNGTTTENAGIAIAQHTTKQLISVVVNGGSISGKHAIYESNPQKNGASDIAKISLSVKGGTFAGDVYSQDITKFITGGTFSSEPDASYIADGYEAVKSGENWVVQVPYAPAPAPTTETTTVTNPDGTTTTTVTDKKTGESTATTKGADGTTVVEKTDAAGTTTTEVTIPASAAEAAAGAPVEVPEAIEVAEGQAVSISAPAGTTVSVPLDSANAGDVVVIVNADGTETPVPLSLIEDGKAIVKLDGNQTIKIVNNAKDFEDVADGHWAADDIDFASSREIFLGIGNGSTYEPETALTRNMMMTVLARVDGADTENSDPWYAKGQAWAVENGVSNGLWGEDSITREQLVTMLFNYANKAGLDTTARADMSSFPDASGVSPWATDAVSWAVAEGILKGVDNTYVAPQGLATRAQAAAFLARYVHAALL